MEEVVVIGYGSQSREKITTSVTKLDKEALKNVPYANAASALQGTASGVRVQSISGQPGAEPRIIVRGGTSINNPNGATPLYLSLIHIWAVCCGRLSDIFGRRKSIFNEYIPTPERSLPYLRHQHGRDVYKRQFSNFP